MARTHKTAHIKAQMAERARQEEEARRKVVSARSDHKRCKTPATHGPRSSAPMRPQKALHPLEYMEATRQKIVIAEVINVARRDADLRKQVRFHGLQDSEIPLVPDKWEPYQRKYI
ncbi:hypothetical protein PF002_g18374, partial [Phytophthora fragariae]